jgi:hypothetical protein
MSRIAAGFGYRARYYGSWLLFGVAVYAVVITATFYVLIRFSLINENEGSLVYRLFFLIISVGAFSMRFKEDFDFFLTLGYSRREIFTVMLSVSLVLSFGVSMLVVAEKEVVDSLNEAIGLRNVIDPFHFVSPYRTGSVVSRFVFFFSLSAGAAVFGILMGSLFYRWGKLFMTLYWIAVSAVPAFILSVMTLVAHHNGRLDEAAASFKAFVGGFGLMPASGYLAAAAVLFGVLAHASIRKLPQK